MERICPYCMHILSEETSCPGCGKKPGAYRPSSHHFAPGTRLHDRYLLGRVLGEGGFGITYLGLDTELERRVAVKEYFPTAFVKRETSLTLAVTCYTGAGQSYYEKGREQFLKEARTMAKLENIPEIVRVLDFFQANNTAYIVMEFLEGETLKDRTARLGRIPSGELLELLRPVMGAMETMHQAGIIHRDISPDNLMCLPDGRVKLMDFGCAKDIGGGRTMTVTLKQGFAPLEQYTGHGQGPWSDLYSLCATIYYCLTGRVPPAALERDKDQDRELDPLLPLNQLGVNLTSRQEWALIKGMALRTRDRWQTIGDLYGALYGVNLDGTAWEEPSGQDGQTEGKTEYVKSEESRFSDDAQIEDTVPPAPEKKRISKRARGVIAACCMKDYTGQFAVFFENGKAVRIPASSYETKSNRKKLVNAFWSGSPAVAVYRCGCCEEYLLISSAARALLVNESQIAEKSTKTSSGSFVFTLKKNNTVVSVTPYTASSPRLVKEAKYRKSSLPSAGVVFEDYDPDITQQTLF